MLTSLPSTWLDNYVAHMLFKQMPSHKLKSRDEFFSHTAPREVDILHKGLTRPIVYTGINYISLIRYRAI